MPRLPAKTTPASEHLLYQVAKLAIDSPCGVYTGMRKILTGLFHSTSCITPVTFDQLGYGKNKLSQLDRTYWNEEEADRIKAILGRRKKQHFTSVAMSMRNKAKDARSMGWCINSIVITRVPKGPEVVTIQYRSTELTLKFGGDLAFLPLIFQRLGLKPDLVQFQFANAYLSGLYFPYLGSFWPGGVLELFKYLEEKDPGFFYPSSRYLFRFSTQKGQRFPYSPAKMAHRFGWAHLDMEAIHEYLKDRFTKLGKPLTVAYHPLEESDE